MRDMAQTELSLERVYPLSEVAAATGHKSNRTLKAVCIRHGVPIIEWSKRSNALTESAYRLLLERVTKSRGGSTTAVSLCHPANRLC